MHGERTLYDSSWVRLAIVDVGLPSGRRIPHHVVRMPTPAVGVVVHDDRGVLMLRRHRFITDTWGWEIPAGKVEAGEDLEAAARRETVEETGWRPLGRLRRLADWHPTNGLSDQRFLAYAARGAEQVGTPEDASEASEVAWLPRDEVRRLVAAGEVRDGLSLVALLWWLADLPQEAGEA